MVTRRLKIIMAIGVFLIAFLILDRITSINAAVSWCRLAKLPVAYTAVKLQSEGSPATREYHLTFTADTHAVERWKKMSPGMEDATHAAPSSSEERVANLYIKPHASDKYIIKPAPGICWAEVDIFKGKRRSTVIIHTWRS